MLPIVFGHRVEDPSLCLRIRQVVENHGYDCTLQTAEQLWQLHSDSYCANWMSGEGLSQAAIWECVQPHITEERLA